MSGETRRDQALQAAAREHPLDHSPPMAVEAAFRRHHEAVFRAAYRITGNPMDAEDVLQTVFTRLLRRDEGQGLEADGAGSYLRRAAVNAALDMLRARRRARAVHLEEVADLAQDPGPGPERRPLARELRSHLRGALARLSPRSAEIFALRYFEGLGNLEIARALGTSTTAVAVILHRARHRLQKELAPLGDLS